MSSGFPRQTLPAHPHDRRFAALPAVVSPRLLVFAGVLMFVLYIFMDVIASLAYDGYSYKDQTISELSAVGAPTRTFWLTASVFYQVLSWAFAIGVLAIAGERRKLRIVGWLLVIFASSGLLWWFGPMHQREVLAADGGDWRDTLHLVTGGISSIIFFTMIGIGAFIFGWRFRLYSFMTIGLMLVFGMLMNMDVSDVADDKATPWLGIYERIAIEGAMLWQAVFAAALLWTTRNRRAPER